MNFSVLVCLLVLTVLQLVIVSLDGLRMMAQGFGKKIVSNSNSNSVSNNASNSPFSRELRGRKGDKLRNYYLLFESLRSQPDTTITDIYCRVANTDTFWFTGKVANRNTIGKVVAVSQLASLITNYAKFLRPREIGGPTSIGTELEVWAAPGNSEMQVAQNKITLEKIERKGQIESDSALEFAGAIGFEPEIYVDNEEGFRCFRDENGAPVKPAFDVQMADPSILNK